MIAPGELYPSEVDPHKDVVPALRQLLCIPPSGQEHSDLEALDENHFVLVIHAGWCTRLAA